MVFDFVSFAGGLIAGASVGVLAGYLHETETLGGLQEHVRVAMLQFERTMSRPVRGDSPDEERADLHRRLLELQDEIKRSYRRREG